MRAGAALLSLALALGLPVGTVLAQGQPGGAGFNTGQVVSPLLTIDPDTLFAGTLYGQRINDELVQATEDLATENRAIEAQLTEEEQSLTRRRPTMEPDAFRAEAQAFDQRVQQIRAEQDAKERALQQIVAQGRDAFVRDASPVLGRMMLERGASVILDRRNVFLAVNALDITEDAIDAIDAALGDGSEEGAAPEEAPAIPQEDALPLQDGADTPPATSE
ncbi:OmpH family outer membrane protein [Pseudoroseicyclus sp. H15]